MLGKPTSRLLFLLILTVAPSSLMAQTFTRTDYEVGVLYQDAVFSAKSPCSVDDFRFVVGWGDDANNVTEVFQQINSTPFPAPANTAYVYGVPRHYYSTPGTYRAEITEVLHCSGASGSTSTTTFSDLNVYPRGEIGGLQTNQPNYKAGEEVHLTVFEPPSVKAQPSGTRVYLKAVSGAQIIDPGEPLVAYIDIPAGQTQAKTTFRLRKAVASTLTISGAANNTKTVSVMVQHD